MRITESQLRTIVKTILREADTPSDPGQQIADDIMKRADAKKFSIEDLADEVDKMVQDLPAPQGVDRQKYNSNVGDFYKNFVATMKKSAEGAPKADPERLKAEKIPADSAFALLGGTGPMTNAIRVNVNRIARLSK